MKKVLSIIFIVAVIVTSVTYGTLNVANQTLNTQTTDITEISNKGIGANYDIKGDKKLVTYAEINDIDKVNPEIAHKYLDADLKKYDIPIEALDYVLKEDDYQGMYYDYRAKAIGYLADKNEKPTLEIDRIKKMTENGLVKYNEDHEEKLNIEKIVTNVEEVAHTIDTKIEKLKENKTITTILSTVTNDKLRVGSLALMIGSAVALMIVGGLLGGFKGNGIAFLVAGSIITLASLLSRIKTPGIIANNIGPALGYIQNKSLVLGIIFLVIGTLFITLSIATAKMTKKEKKETNEE